MLQHAQISLEISLNVYMVQKAVVMLEVGRRRRGEGGKRGGEGEKGGIGGGASDRSDINKCGRQPWQRMAPVSGAAAGL